MLSLVPVFIPSYTITIPFAIQLWIFNDRPVAALCLVLLHFGAWFFIDPIIQTKIKASNHRITGMAVVGGITAFGLEGALIGPMLVCVLLIMHKEFGDLRHLGAGFGLKLATPPQELSENERS